MMPKISYQVFIHKEGENEGEMTNTSSLWYSKIKETFFPVILIGNLLWFFHGDHIELF